MHLYSSTTRPLLPGAALAVLAKRTLARTGATAALATASDLEKTPRALILRLKYDGAIEELGGAIGASQPSPHLLPTPDESFTRRGSGSFVGNHEQNLQRPVNVLHHLT
jgi:hypothetical protein